MISFNFNPFPTLHTERLVLRQVTTHDVNEIFFHRSNERMMQYIQKKPAADLEEAYEWIKKIEMALDSNTGITWGISLKNETKLIGTVAFWRTIPEHHRAEIGYMLHYDYQGQGLMQEAVTAILQYGFNDMKLHSVEAHVNPDNKMSIKLLKKNGFVKEAYFKEDFYFDGKYYDSAVYSLLNKPAGE